MASCFKTTATAYAPILIASSAASLLSGCFKKTRQQRGRWLSFLVIMPWYVKIFTAIKDIVFNVFQRLPEGICFRAVRLSIHVFTPDLMISTSWEPPVHIPVIVIPPPPFPRIRGYLCSLPIIWTSYLRKTEIKMAAILGICYHLVSKKQPAYPGFLGENLPKTNATKIPLFWENENMHGVPFAFYIVVGWDGVNTS